VKLFVTFHQNFTRQISKKSGRIFQGNAMKILNVAEKNDAAKSIANILSGGNSNRVSKFMLKAFH